ncbi:hypothetical protein KC343_g7416 [Hortaea werneckii]|nr:hypothetical protein KC352_g17994 [Hortaea werneckii]KAI7563361.1 hypothetical protein KC317_g7784 [Hortaea werneckii]KAI7613581.1 hypothetical protein KC346_g7304 [Hortaea werneckii]KAI7623146.1 hypothetical protein KC343_g7416 [Hortaea werneckii]KAI7661322.1 hypothetical protein KC319_g8437 [Hortaea werneckii]
MQTAAPDYEVLVAGLHDPRRRGGWVRRQDNGTLGGTPQYFSEVSQPAAGGAGRFSGVNAFIYYAPTLFTLLGQAVLSLILAGTQNIGQLIAVIAAFLIVDATGRRTLAIWGAFAMGVPYVVIAALYGLYSDAWPARPAAGWACIAMGMDWDMSADLHNLDVYIGANGILYWPLAWTLPSEVYSTVQRSKGVALATATAWLSKFIVGVATPPMISQAGLRDKRKQRTEIPIDIAQEALSSDMHNGTLGSMMSAAGLDASPLPSQRRSAPDSKFVRRKEGQG